jgi:hypothetical protein
MCLAITVVALFGAFVPNTERLKHTGRTTLHGLEMFLLEFLGELLKRFGAAAENDFIVWGEYAHIRPLQLVLQITAEPRLGIPVIKGHGQLVLGVHFTPLVQQLLPHAQLAVI